MVVGVPGVVGVVGLVAAVPGPVVAVVLAVAVVLVPAVTVPPRLSIHHVLDTAALVIQSAITGQIIIGLHDHLAEGVRFCHPNN